MPVFGLQGLAGRQGSGPEGVRMPCGREGAGTAGPPGAAVGVMVPCPALSSPGRGHPAREDSGRRQPLDEHVASAGLRPPRPALLEKHGQLKGWVWTWVVPPVSRTDTELAIRFLTQTFSVLTSWQDRGRSMDATVYIQLNWVQPPLC